MFTFDAGGGVTLRLLEQRDAPVLQQTIVANLEHFDPWFHWHRRHSDSQQHAADWIRGNLERHARGGGHDAGIFVAADDDDRARGLVDHAGLTLAGMCGIHEIDKLDHFASFGYWLSAKHCGKGLVTRCVAKQCDWFFTADKLHRLEVHCAAGNTASRAIPERLGFTLEATHRERIFRNNIWHDEIVYAMLASDWQLRGGADASLLRVKTR
jgi:ribosomal-protein-serine acetyltransferase